MIRGSKHDNEMEYLQVQIHSNQLKMLETFSGLIYLRIQAVEDYFDLQKGSLSSRKYTSDKIRLQSGLLNEISVSFKEEKT